MSASPEIARANGRKGGRPKGSKAAHTLKAEQGKALLIQMYLEQVRPINQALIDKALTGDIQAIRELHERVYGKSVQPIEGNIDSKITIKTINYGNNPTVSL